MRAKIFASLLLAVAILVGLWGGTPQADAQSVVVDTWSGKNESPTRISKSCSSIAIVVTASTGKVLNVRSMVLSDGTGGVATFYSGGTVVGSKVIGHFYLVANVPQYISEEFLRGGMKSASGEGIYVVSGGTLTAWMSVRTE